MTDHESDEPEDGLTLTQLAELAFGPAPNDTAFESDEERQDAWREHWGWVTAYAGPGRRPWALWEYGAVE